MPFSSSARTSVASVYRGGGSVKCCFGSIVFDVEFVALRRTRQDGLRLPSRVRSVSRPHPSRRPRLVLPHILA